MVIALTAAVTGPVQAFEGPVARQASTTAGLYLTIPLGGRGLSRLQAPFHYGFAVRTHLTYRSQAGIPVGGTQYRVEALNLRFGKHGFEALSSGEFHWLRRGGPSTLYAKDGDNNTLMLLGVGAAAIGLSLALTGGGDDCASGTSRQDGSCLPPVSF